MKLLYSIEEDAEECYPLDYFEEMLEFDDHKTSLRLFVWKPKFGTGDFWCGYHGEGFESGEGLCGKLECSGYEARNGKSGRCRFHSAPYYLTKETITIEK